MTGSLADSQFNIWCDRPTAETEDQVADGVWSGLARVGEFARSERCARVLAVAAVLRAVSASVDVIKMSSVAC